MRIGVFTWGTEGDVRPFVALAAGLVRRGHQVELSYVMIDGRDLGELCASHGVLSRFVARETAVAAFTRPGPHQDVINGRGGSPLKQVQSILKGLLDPVTPELFDDALAHVARYDLVIVHFLHHPAATAALARGVPVVFVLTAPATPTRELPPIGAPSLGPLNRAVWRLAEALAGGWFLPRINALRGRVGLAPMTRMYPEPNPEVTLALTCVSPTLLARPCDWAPNAHVVGFFDLPVAPSAVPPEVQVFLDAGEPPVLLTFGSMLATPAPETRQCIKAMLGAVERSGVRAIVQVPTHALAEYASGERVLIVGALPHALVLPRCALVVHHGGAGTTQATMLAGRPSVVVPFLADQFFWAERLRNLGVALRPVPRKKLRADRLARAISAALAAPSLPQRAAELAEAMRGEDGVRAAAELIEGCRGPRTPPESPAHGSAAGDPGTR